MAEPLSLLDSDRRLGRHVTVLTGENGGKYPHGNSVLITGSTGVVMVDPSLSVHGRRVAPGAIDRVLISHAHEDHLAGVSAVAARTVHVHRDDLIGVQSMAGLMEVYGLDPDVSDQWRHEVETAFHFSGCPGATGFTDGDRFDLGAVDVRVVHLPGHTRGHSAFVIEPDGVAFVGDVDLSSFGPYYGDHWSDLEDFVASLARVREIEARHYVTFHHRGVVSGRDDFVAQVDAFASVIDRRDEALLAQLTAPHTLDGLVEVGLVYRPGTRPAMFGESVERRSIDLHLARLVRLGSVTMHPDGTYEAM